MSQKRRSLRNTIPPLHGLLLFEASARHLNFSKAADELAVTQSAVSHGVRQLEDTLGHPLFLRESRSLVLTSAGVKLFATLSASLGSIAETVNDISTASQRDTVVISTSTVVATEWLLPLLREFRRDSPDVKVEVRCYDRDPDLMSNGIDVQLRLGHGNWPGYEAVELWPERIFVVCSPDYLRQHGPISSVDDLISHPLIMYSDPHRLRVSWPEWLRSQNAAKWDQLKVLLQVNDSLVSMKAAEAGEGLAIAWAPLVNQSLKAGRLVRALPNEFVTGRHHYLLTVQSSAQRRVVKFVCDWLKRSRIDLEPDLVKAN